MSTTNLILHQLPRFPAHVSATNGLTAVVDGGVDLVIKPDYGALVPVPAVTNPSATYFMAWDRDIDYYQSISFSDFADNLAEQVLVGTIGAIADLTMAADQGIYFSDPTTAAAYSLSTFVRGISGSADAPAFRTAIGVDPGLVYATKSANYTALVTERNFYFRFTANATFSLPAAATLGANWSCIVYAYGGDVTVDPNASETINGSTTLVIRAGESMQIVCDGTNFFGKLIPSFLFFYTTKSANYTALYTDLNYTLRFTAAATLSLTAAATLGNAWRIRVMNTSTGDVTVDPNSTELINGVGTLILKPNQTVDIVCDGSAFWADVHGDTLSGPQLQGYSTGLTLSTSAGDAANDVTIAAGAAAADTSPYNLMQLSSAITKQLDATWAVGNNAGGLDTGSVANSTYYIWLIQRSDTGVTDALFSLSSTAPTMPTSYDRKRLIGAVIRASSVNSAPSPLLGNIRQSVPLTFSGTTFDVTGIIPSNAKRVTVILANMSTNASSGLIQLGTSGGIVTTGYTADVTTIIGSTAAGLAATTGHFLSTANASYNHTGAVTFENAGGNTWVGRGQTRLTGGSLSQHTSAVVLGGVLDRIRFTTVLGSNAISGTGMITWEV